MKITYKFSMMVALFLMVTATACDKGFEEVNTNPNNPESVSPSLLLPAVIRNSANEIAGKAWGIGNVVMQYTAKIEFTNEDRYNWGPEGNPYGTFYNSLRDVNNIIQLSEASGHNNYVGIAKVIKSYMFSFMTDAYGDLPYTEAIRAKEGVNYPKFDRQEVIYQGILADLEEANGLIGSTEESVEGDILFQGDLLKWRKFANSLRLRIHMRLADRIDPSPGMHAIVSNPEAHPIIENNNENAALQYLSDVPNQHNLYTTRAGSFDEYRLSKHMEDVLKAYNDPRLFAYAQPTTASDAGLVGDPSDYSGVPNGLADESALEYSPSGDPSKGGSNYLSRAGLLFSCSACSSLASPLGYQTVIIGYSEIQFILAEAREKGIITTGDAETYYLNGIRGSFDYYEERLNVADLTPIAEVIQPADSYYLQPEIAFIGSTAQKLEKIGMQKWLSLFFNGMEAWYDWRRTGIPDISPGPAAFVPTVPVRFMYPTSVQALNKENYDIAIQNQGEDRITTRVWWDVE
jgi:hypothetical protein